MPSRPFGHYTTITKADAKALWESLDNPSVSSLADAAHTSQDRAYWLMDAYGLENIERGVFVQEMDRHQFWYFMRKLTRCIDEHGWDKWNGHKERHGDLPLSVLRESERRRGVNE